jgi:hypothetical protein
VVGGLGSPPNDDFFDPILDRLGTTSDGRPFRAFRFGWDRGDRYRYDTYGAIDRSALTLRALIRDLSDECVTTDVLAHSMGGVVADRAFSMGVSAADGVTAYVPLASPHNGSFDARAVRFGVELDDTYAALASTVAQRTGLHDPTSAAVRDLAVRRSPRPPRGVVAVRQKLVHDLMVLHGDLADRRMDVRELLPTSLDEFEAHSGIVHNARAVDVAVRTIREHAVPGDDRTDAERRAAFLAARAVQRYWGGVVAAAGLAMADVAAGAVISGAVRNGDADDLGEFGERLGSHLADGADLVQAALALRTPLPFSFFEMLVPTVVDRD